MYAVANVEQFVKDHPGVVGARGPFIITRARELSQDGNLLMGNQIIEVMGGDTNLTQMFHGVASADPKHIQLGLTAMQMGNMGMRVAVGIDSRREIDSVIDAMAAFPNLRWNLDRSGEDGCVAFVVLNGDKKTGNYLILAAIERAVLPAHMHLGEAEGEVMWTLVGELHDGDAVFKPSSSAQHVSSATQQLHAPKFWLGLYRQHKGSRPVE